MLENTDKTHQETGQTALDGLTLLEKTKELYKQLEGLLIGATKQQAAPHILMGYCMALSAMHDNIRALERQEHQTQERDALSTALIKRIFSGSSIGEEQL